MYSPLFRSEHWGGVPYFYSARHDVWHHPPPPRRVRSWPQEGRQSSVKTYRRILIELVNFSEAITAIRKVNRAITLLIYRYNAYSGEHCMEPPLSAGFPRGWRTCPSMWSSSPPCTPRASGASRSSSGWPDSTSWGSSRRWRRWGSWRWRGLSTDRGHIS